jgi:hypothetical protein
MAYQDGLNHANSGLDPLSALRAPVTALLGVSTPAANLLTTLGVITIYDLATLPILVQAREIALAAEDRGSGAVAWLDRIPGGYVSGTEAGSLDTLTSSPVTALRGIDAALAQQLSNLLQIDTVGDLGRWLPFTFARQILEVATRGGEDTDDPAQELVPRMGEYPTERCFYTTVLIDHVEAAATEDLKTAGAIDIAPTVDADFGFSAPAVGARLTFGQSWFAHGVTLGNLLHSVALAPGESTRIAVVDWSRRTRSSATEAITEAERLAASTSHNRAVSEVQDAVATEAQSGFSHTESKSTTLQAGASGGFSAGPVSFGGSASAARTTTSADSFSSSFGARELSASMSQKVMDSTQQAASSTRDRRASLVMEVSESEHESVSTRILANYNHMHALTIQYYEVIEIYRVTVDLVQVERCLFVPMKLVEMNEATIRRYQPVLADAALTRRARELLTSEFGTVRVTPVAPRRPWRGLFEAVVLDRTRMMARRVGEPTPDDPAAPVDPTTPTPTPPPPTPTPTPPAPDAPGSTLPQYDELEIARASRITALDIVRSGSGDLFLPRDAMLSAVAIQLSNALVPADKVTLKLAGGAVPVELVSQGFEWRVPRPVALEDIAEIVLTTGGASGTGTGSMTLQLQLRGALFPVTMPIQVTPSTSATVCRMGDLDLGPELVEHLQGNRLHYSQAIWRSLDASTIALLLSKYTFDGLPVADQVDPEPLMIAGNYVVLRMPAFTERRDAPAPRGTPAPNPLDAARGRWRDWLTERGLTFGREAASEQLVPIPTGGVFAEAVLGRSNSAEKLDATRFWNWQDSPIPLAPPEIAAISMGSRAQPLDARPGQLGQPVLNIVSPTTLPEPTGLGAAFGALSSGGMFRDMSGLAGGQGLAGTVAGLSAGAARSAGELAQAAMATAAQKEVSLEQIKAAKGAVALSSPHATTGSPKNITEAGATLNTAREMDKAAGVGGGGGRAGGGGTGGAGGASGGSGGITGGTSPTIAGAGSHSRAAFDRMVWGPTGTSAADLVNTSLPDTGGGGGGSGGGVGVAPNEIYFWAGIRRNDDVTSLEEEVQALADERWVPAAPDFRAISIRSAKWGPMRPDAEIDSLDKFFKMLTEPAFRFNFFAYRHDSIMLSGNAGIGTFGSASASRNGVDLIRIDLANLTRIRQLVNGNNSDPIVGLIRAIRQQNAAHKAAVRDEMNNPVNRQLRLYLAVIERPSDPFRIPDPDVANSLANLLQMDVFQFPAPIWWEPILRLTPPDQLRGRIRFDPTPGQGLTQDIHTLDNNMDLFS